MCPVQLVADGSSHSAENSAAAHVIGAADVPASSAWDYPCPGLAYGPEPALPGTLLRLFLPLGLGKYGGAHRSPPINVKPHPACGGTTCPVNDKKSVSALGGRTALEHLEQTVILVHRLLAILELHSQPQMLLPVPCDFEAA